MDQNNVFPDYQRNKPDGHNYLLSKTPYAPAVGKRKKWPLAVLLLILLLGVVCIFPRVTQFEAAMAGAEVSPDGTVIASGSFVLEGRIHDYLLREDTCRLDALQVPNRELGKLIDQSFPLWETESSLLHTRVWVTLPEYTSENNWYTGELLFPEDQSWWVLYLTDRIFIGSGRADCDYAAILDALRPHPAQP